MNIYIAVVGESRGKSFMYKHIITLDDLQHLVAAIKEDPDQMDNGWKFGAIDTTSVSVPNYSASCHIVTAMITVMRQYPGKDYFEWIQRGYCVVADEEDACVFSTQSMDHAELWAYRSFY